MALREGVTAVRTTTTTRTKEKLMLNRATRRRISIRSIHVAGSGKNFLTIAIVCEYLMAMIAHYKWEKMKRSIDIIPLNVVYRRVSQLEHGYARVDRNCAEWECAVIFTFFISQTLLL